MYWSHCACLFSTQHQATSRWKLETVGIFTPWKLASIIHWRFGEPDVKPLSHTFFSLKDPRSLIAVVVQSLSRVVSLFVTPWLPCPSLSPGVCSHSCPLSQWCRPTISSSVVPFSSRLQSFPASGSLPMSQLFPSGCQRIGASASALPVNIQLTSFRMDCLDLLSKARSRVFSSLD